MMEVMQDGQHESVEGFQFRGAISVIPICYKQPRGHQPDDADGPPDAEANERGQRAAVESPEMAKASSSPLICEYWSGQRFPGR